MGNVASIDPRAEWGDGTAGSMTYDATGTGFTQTVPIYGRVPGQRTPTPGDYTDKVTATIYFQERTVDTGVREQFMMMR